MDASGFDLADLHAGERALLETLPLADQPRAPMLQVARDALCASLRRHGLTPIISDDWRDLERLNRANRESWFPLLPRPAGAPAFWIGACDMGGEVVATHAAVLVDCGGASFGERLGDLSLFHGDGGAPADEWGFCASEAAFATTGPVAWIVAGWTRPDRRGRGLFHTLGAAVRLVSWDRWWPLWWVGLVDPETVPVWSGRGAGRRRLEPRPGVLYHQSGVGRLPLHFMRWSRAAVMLDMQALEGQCRETADNTARAPVGIAHPINAWS